MRTLVIAAGLVALGALAPRAQQQGVFRSKVDVVPVFATVTAADGSFVSGLTRDDFIVLDDGKPQEIVSFADTAQAISVSVILDTSGSMAAALPRVYAAARVFLDKLLPDDRAMVGTLFFQGPPLTADKSRLRHSLDLAPRDPGSPTWAALDRSLTALSQEANRRVIVIYTDGKNNVGGRVRIAGSERQVRSRVETEGAMIYAIGFEGVSLSSAIKSIARKSGGRAIELKRTDDLGATFGGVADELHRQYLLGITPAVFDGRVHAIDVRMRTPGLTVRARQTYVAKSGGIQ
jgi:Ca-activated chloride channel family protein